MFEINLNIVCNLLKLRLGINYSQIVSYNRAMVNLNRPSQAEQETPHTRDYNNVTFLDNVLHFNPYTRQEPRAAGSKYPSEALSTRQEPRAAGSKYPSEALSTRQEPCAAGLIT